MACLVFHKWGGCKCRRCGKLTDERHDWDGCKCRRCGVTGPIVKIAFKCPHCGKRLLYLHLAPDIGAYDGVRCPFCSEDYRYIANDRGHNWFIYTEGNPYYSYFVCVNCGATEEHDTGDIVYQSTEVKHKCTAP